MRRLRLVRPRLSYANAVSLLAVFLAMGGTALAAYGTAAFKDSSVTSAKIANGTIGLTDVATATRTYLTTNATQRGPTGDQGDKGPAGGKFTKQWSYAYYDSGRLKKKGTEPPNGSSLDWHDPSYNGGNENGNGELVPLQKGNTQLLILQASDTNSGLLSVPTSVPNANVIVIANVSLWHRGTVHTRVGCNAQIKDTVQGGAFQTIGVPVWASTNVADRVVNIGVVAAASITPSTYTLRIVCRNEDKDDLLADDWNFVKGNLNVLSTRDE